MNNHHSTNGGGTSERNVVTSDAMMAASTAVAPVAARDDVRAFVVRLPAAQHEELKEAAAIEGVSMGEFVRNSIDIALREHHRRMRAIRRGHPPA